MGSRQADSARRRLQLLEDIRQYGRLWLRHEFEAFFGRYGDGLERSTGLDMQSDFVSVDPACNPEMERAETTGVERRICGDESPRGDSGLAGQPWTQNSLQASVSRGVANHVLSPLRRLFDRARGFVRELIFAGAIAMAGPDDLQAEDVTALDRSVKAQVEYFNRFEREIIENPPPELGEAALSQVILVNPPRSVAQRIAQAESYGNSVWEAVINTGRAKVKKQGVFDKERRVHLLAEDQHKYCKTCITESRKGWQPLGTLNEIGDSECMGSCDCYFEWLGFDGKIYVSPWGRHNPKGYNQPGSSGTRLPGIAYPSDQPVMPPNQKPTKPVEIIQPAPDHSRDRR